MSSEKKKNLPCRNPLEKIFSEAEKLVSWRESLKKKGLKLVLTNGCFDILHRGHTQYLYGARSAGDALLVLLNSDSSVKSLKGEGRPVNREMDRAYVLASLECVDAVYIFSSPRCDREIAMFKPDFYAKGADYTVEKMDKGELASLRDCGAQIAFIQLVPGLSTTGIIKKSGELARGKNEKQEHPAISAGKTK